MLLFEKNGIAPPSTPSPSTIGNQPVLPPTAESMEINHQETETTTDECHIDIDMSQPALPQCSPLPTPPEESMSIDIHRSQPPSPSSSPVVTPPEKSLEHSPQVTPQEQTPPSPALSGRQQMLCLYNPSNVCYANAGTNLLFSSPLVTMFLSTLPAIFQTITISVIGF